MLLLDGHINNVRLGKLVSVSKCAKFSSLLYNIFRIVIIVISACVPTILIGAPLLSRLTIMPRDITHLILLSLQITLCSCKYSVILPVR